MKLYDRNGDGSLDAKELERQSAAWGTPAEPQGAVSRPSRFADRGRHFRPAGGVGQVPGDALFRHGHCLP